MLLSRGLGCPHSFKAGSFKWELNRSLTDDWENFVSGLSLPQVLDSENNNYVAWETMIINHKPGNCFMGILTALWKGIIYLGGLEKKTRSPRAPSGYCIAESHGIAAGEQLPLAVINPCVLDCLSTRHPLGHQPLGSWAIVSGLLSQTEGLLELRN